MLSSVHERHHVFEPPPPFTALVMTASGSTMTMPATPMKGGHDAQVSYRERQKGGREEQVQCLPRLLVGRFSILFLVNF